VLCTGDTSASTDAGSVALPVSMITAADALAMETSLPGTNPTIGTGFPVPIVLPPPIV